MVMPTNNTIPKKPIWVVLNITLNQLTLVSTFRLEYIGAVPNEYELINPYDEVEYILLPR
jgi:hypothetical protein